MVRIALAQPLPSLAYTAGLEFYSEFTSLGFAILGGILRDSGYAVRAIGYPSNTEYLSQLVKDADLLILGDFRYYAYFCNPLPLILRSLHILRDIGFDRTVIVAGRHAKYFSTTLARQPEAAYQIRLCEDMGALARALSLPTGLAMRLGSDVLPLPGYAPTDLLLSPKLQGSASRPIRGLTGQLVIASGCRFHCSFCEKANTPVLHQPLDVLERQLGELASAGVTYLIIWDEVFAAMPEVDGVLAALRRSGLRFGCNTRIDVITETLADRLAMAGCEAVLLGMEFAPREEKARLTLGVDRGKAPGEMVFRKTVRTLTERGIATVGSVIIGLPEDTEDGIRGRLGVCRSFGLRHVYIRPLVPFPESPLYHHRLKSGAAAPYDSWQAEQLCSYPHGYPTLCAAVSREELCRVIQESP